MRVTATLRKLFLLFHTIRHLRFSQIIGQVCHRLRPLWEDADSFSQQSAPLFSGCAWPVSSSFLAPGSQFNQRQDILAGRLCFLNQEKSIAWPLQWHLPDVSRLWEYNLHYLEYLWPLAYDEAKALVLDWIEKYPLKSGRAGWEPYPVSLRLMNLCTLFFGKYREQTEGDAEFLRKLWPSIYLQTEWLARHLETHLAGNHLLENATALAVVGSCFAGYQAQAWFKHGQSLLQREIAEQILPDGMHFELSPMYHSRVLYLLQLLLHTGNPALQNLVQKPLPKMITALRHLCHPDRRISLLNDSAGGIYNEPDTLIAWNQETSCMSESLCGEFALPDAGYYGFRDHLGNYLICDAGKIGPDYIPGHAHADMFSFELSLRGHRVIVDSGVCDYELTPLRQYCRSTKAHNTVEIEGQDQCEMWGSFRVARRGRPRNVQWTPQPAGFRLSGWHDGYHRLKGKPRHHREFLWANSGSLAVTDTISSAYPVSCVSRLHLHPICQIQKISGDQVIIAYPAGTWLIHFTGDGQLQTARTYYCPEFGIKIENQCIAFHTKGVDIKLGFQIQSL